MGGDSCGNKGKCLLPGVHRARALSSVGLPVVGPALALGAGSSCGHWQAGAWPRGAEPLAQSCPSQVSAPARLPLALESARVPAAASVAMWPRGPGAATPSPVLHT